MKSPTSKFFSCKRKRSHASAIDAIGAIMESKDWMMLGFYSCTICEGWHLFNKAKGRK